MKKNNKNNELVIAHKSAKLSNFASKAIILVVAIITLAIGILAIGITVYFETDIGFASEKSLFTSDNIPLNILSSLIILILLFLIYKFILPKINNKLLLVIVLIFAMIGGLWWVNYIKFKPISDQAMVMYSATSILNGDFELVLDPGQYVNRNPHQLGFVLYLVILFKMFCSQTPLNAQILNVLYSVASAFLLYQISIELFQNKKVQKILSLLLAAFSVYWSFFSVHVYGNLPGLMFGLLALLFVLKYFESHKFWHLIVVAISITIAYILKSNYEIFLCAILVELLLYTIINRKFKPLLGMAMIIICVFGTKSLVYSYVEYKTGYSLDTGVDMSAYIYMGIAEPVTLTPGWYTADVESIYAEADYDKEKSKEIATEKLSDRLEYFANNLDYTAEYFSSKFQTTWLNPTFQTIWCSIPGTILEEDVEYNFYITDRPLIIKILTGTTYDHLEDCMDIFQIITFIFASIGLIASIKQKKYKLSLLPLAFLGGFVFHMIWETKAIYVIQYFYIMLPYAAYGLYTVFEKINRKLCKKVEN